MKRLLYIGNKLSIHGNTSTSIETLGNFLEKEDYKIYYSSSKKNKILRLLDMLFSTLKYSKKVDYVLIDTYSTYNFWYAFIISQICRILNVKYIPKLHGGDLPNRIKKSKWFCNHIFNNAYINVAPSDYLYNFFKLNSYDNLIYIPNTIEIENYPFTIRKNDYPRLLWVRSFAKIYNPLMAVKVLKLIIDKYPNAELVMIGPKKDDSFDEVKDFVDKFNLNVIFTGKLTKEEWVELSKKSNIFINTTHFDNTPVSVIEAMALGLPVISTNVGGIPYLIKNNENGLLVDDNDIEKMAEQIDKIIADNHLSERIAFEALETVKEFDWKVVKNEWFKLLQ